jgi:hypothetical protein
VESLEVPVKSLGEGEREIAGLFSEWAQTLGLRFRGSLRLAMAETKLAVTSFVLMIFLVVLAAGAVILAWMLLLAALVQALSLAGLQLLLAIVAVGALHLVLAWVLWRTANRLGRYMEFRATRRLLDSRS